MFIYFQANSFYGLLDVESIKSPMLSGKYLQLPYFPGHCYAAIKPEDSSQVVSFISFNALRFLISKKPTMTVQREKPQSLIYHIHSFHVLDMKVFTIYHSTLALSYFLGISVLVHYIWNSRSNLAVLPPCLVCS